jgi:hypothetical protein
MLSPHMGAEVHPRCIHPAEERLAGLDLPLHEVCVGLSWRKNMKNLAFSSFVIAMLQITAAARGADIQDQSDPFHDHSASAES